MKKWAHEIEIQAPIERVWQLFDGSLEETKKIMPKITAIESIKETEEEVGSIYRQIFSNGQKYEVETLEYVDTFDYKKLKTGFIIPGMLNITSLYELDRLENGNTKFFSETTNDPLRFDMKILLFFTGNKSVVKFVEQVRVNAESTD